MRKLKIFGALCLTALAAFAQESLVVKYQVTNCDTDTGEPYSYEMILMANPKKSLFYDSMSLYCDSCNSTPEGKAKLHEIQMKAWKVVYPDGTVTYDGRKLGLAPEKKVYLYVEKDAEANQLSVYDFKGEALYRYNEPFSEMEWEIMDNDSRKILDYEYLMAKSNYHGREWTVWFTPDIPVQDGPWKLHGLPGLILTADGGDGIRIEATEIGKTQNAVPSVYSVNEYTEGDRRKILADHEHYINNLESILAAQGIKINGDGTPGNLPKYNRQKRAWETDY